MKMFFKNVTTFVSSESQLLGGMTCETLGISTFPISIRKHLIAVISLPKAVQGLTTLGEVWSSVTSLTKRNQCDPDSSIGMLVQ